MAEPIQEQIAAWIQTALDGVQDPDVTMTLRAVRPKILDWTIQDFKHGDVVIEADTGNTQGKTTTDSRGELLNFKCYGIIRTLPADTAADTIIARLIETIRRTLLAGNENGRACGGKAKAIDCPNFNYGLMDGGVVAEVDVQVTYRTGLFDGYEQK